MLAALAATGFFLGWNTPNHYAPWPTFHGEWLAAFGLAALWLSLSFARTAHALGPQWSAAALLPLLLALAPLGQWLAGRVTFISDALLASSYFVATALALMAGRWLAMRLGARPALIALAGLLVVSGLAANYVAMGQWLGNDVPGWWAMELIDDRPYGNLGQPNHFGLLMVWSLLASLALFEWHVIRQRWVAAGLVLFFLTGMASSGSRAAVLAMALAAASWLWASYRAPGRLRKRELGVLLVLVVVALPLLDAARSAVQPGTAGAAPAREVLEAGPRPLIWRHALAAIAVRPWLGHGPNQNVAAFASVADDVAPSRNVISAHNVFLDLALWFGLPVAVIVTAAVGLALVRLWRCAARPGDGAAGARWVMALLGALLVQSQFEYPFAHSHFLLPAALAAGVVLGGAAQNRPARGTAVFAHGLALASAGLLAMLAVDYARIEQTFRQNRFAAAGINAAVSAAPVSEAVWTLDQLAALSDSASLRARAGMPASEIEALRLLARRFHMLSGRLEYAKALALNGRPVEAEAELRVIRSALPAHEYRAVERYWRAWRAGIP